MWGGEASSQAMEQEARPALLAVGWLSLVHYGRGMEGGGGGTDSWLLLSDTAPLSHTHTQHTPIPPVMPTIFTQYFSFSTVLSIHSVSNIVQKQVKECYLFRGTCGGGPGCCGTISCYLFSSPPLPHPSPAPAGSVAKGVGAACSDAWRSGMCVRSLPAA